MPRILKIGSQYLTADGTLSSNQADALRVSDAIDKATILNLRPVKLTPHRYVADPCDHDTAQSSPF